MFDSNYKPSSTFTSAIFAVLCQNDGYSTLFLFFILFFYFWHNCDNTENIVLVNIKLGL